MSPQESTLDKRTRLASDPHKPEETYVPTPDEVRLAQKIEDNYRKGKDAKTLFERQAYVNHAAFFGSHWAEWNSVLQKFQIPARSTPSAARVQVPWMLAYFRRTLSRLTAHKPGFFVQPVSPDQEDQERSDRALHALESEYERLGMEKKIREFVGLMLEGNALIEFSWNPFAGRDLKAEDGQPVLDSSGRQVRQGDTEAEVFSMFELTVDGDATDLQEDAQWAIRSAIRTTSWIRRHYPEMGRFVKGEDVWINETWRARHRNVVGIQGSVDQTSAREKIGDAALVHAYWERPTAERPKGRLVVTAGGLILFKGPIPYTRLLRESGLWIPIVHSGEVKVPGRFWFSAMCEFAFPLNRLLNRAVTQEEVNRGIFGNGKWLRPSTCSIIEGSFDGPAGEAVVYESSVPGQKPEQVTYQSVSAATETVINRALQFIQETLAWHEPSRGILPSATTPGVAIDMLQKADDTSLGATEANLRDALSQMGRIILSFVAQFWSEERLARRTGEDGRTVSRGISGKDIDSDEEGFTFDVRVTPHSMSWRDPEEQRKLLDYLVQRGFIDPKDPMQRAEALKILDRADTRSYFRDDQLDVGYSNEENEMMAAGTFSFPMPFENHALHRREHDRYRKSDKYRLLPPERKKLFDDHDALHEQMTTALELKRAGQAKAVQAVLAGPGPGGSARGTRHRTSSAGLRSGRGSRTDS